MPAGYAASIMAAAVGEDCPSCARQTRGIKVQAVGKRLPRSFAARKQS